MYKYTQYIHILFQTRHVFRSANHSQSFRTLRPLTSSVSFSTHASLSLISSSSTRFAYSLSTDARTGISASYHRDPQRSTVRISAVILQKFQNLPALFVQCVCIYLYEVYVLYLLVQYNNSQPSYFYPSLDRFPLSKGISFAHPAALSLTCRIAILCVLWQMRGTLLRSLFVNRYERVYGLWIS